MADFDNIIKPLKLLNPGNPDGWNRVYATVAAANAAIPNNYVDIEEGGAMVSRSLRYGKVVQIGTVTDHVEYRWIGGFSDTHLKPYLDTQVDFTPIENEINNIQGQVLGVKNYALPIPLSYRMYVDSSNNTAIGDFITQTKNQDGSYKIVNYKDIPGKRVPYLNTSISTISDVHSIYIEFKIASLNTINPSLGIGFGSDNSEIGIMYRDLGTLFIFDKYNSLTTLRAANTDFAYTVGDTVRVEILTAQNGNLSVRTSKNGVYSPAIAITQTFSGTLKVNFSGSIDGDYVISTLVDSQLQNTIDQKVNAGKELAVNEAVNDVFEYIIKPDPTSSPVSIPSPTYNYVAYTGAGAGTHRHIKVWYFGKSSKVADRIGFFIYCSVIPTTGGRLEILREREGATSIIARHNITQAELQGLYSASYSGNPKDYEYIINLPQRLSIEAGDKLFFSLQVLSGVVYFIGDERYLLASGEWNDGIKCYRQVDITNTDAPLFATIPAIPSVTGINYVPIHFYELNEANNFKIQTVIDLQNQVEELSSGSKLPIVGNTSYISKLDGVDFKVVTSDSYDYRTKKDVLMIICHGNGNDYSSSAPSSAFQTWARKNGLSWANITTQTTDSTVGYGNRPAMNRIMSFYKYLMDNFNFDPFIILNGTSMGGTLAGNVIYSRVIPIRFFLLYGGVPNLTLRFNNGNSARREIIRKAYGMNSDGSDDANVSQFVRGYDWWLKELLTIDGVEYKTVPVPLHMYIGGGDSNFTEFGGSPMYERLRDAINRAGGLSTYYVDATKTHADAAMWDKVLTDGIFEKYMKTV